MTPLRYSILNVLKHYDRISIKELAGMYNTSEIHIHIQVQRLIEEGYGLKLKNGIVTKKRMWNICKSLFTGIRKAN
jgi:DeoR/GlpR family transcriptional regulator of sugar metabolism